MVANIAATLAMGRFKFSPLGVALPQLRKEQYAGKWLIRPSLGLAYFGV
jgi:hypothetical protein